MSGAVSRFHFTLTARVSELTPKDDLKAILCLQCARHKPTNPSGGLNPVHQFRNCHLERSRDSLKGEQPNFTSSVF